MADHWQINYYVITPGQASPVSQYISVPAEYRHPLTGKILLTDVYVTQLNAFNYLQYRFFDSNSEIFPGGELFEGAPTQGQFLNQGYLQMAQAQNFATAAALTHLGYHVSSSNGGALDLRHPGQIARRRGRCRWPRSSRRSMPSPPRRCAR